MQEPLPSQYDPKEIESRLYDFWSKLNIFTARSDSKKKKYCIIMPPPNVTGVLHMGHALMCTLEDILARRKRMEGFETLWLPGTDHAGIATQMVVERNLAKELKKSRHDLGREAFLKKVWEWKEQSEKTILSQLKVMGSSCDWTRLTFTLDEKVSQSVREAFVRLFNEGLIYRDEAITQWCPRCETALSDLEVKAQERKSKLWHIKYPLKNKNGKYVVVATTRPETIPGDVAVAVNPKDVRYQDLHGEILLLPLLNKEIKLIADDYVDPTFGTGALKITPGHDTNDYEVGKRHKLPIVSIFDNKAFLNESAGHFKGLSRDQARDKIVKELEEKGLLEKVVDHSHNVGCCDRCGTVLEPRVSRQWFVKADILAKPAIEAVETKQIKLIPEEWEKTYFSWMRNIRPWCISRQLWWGHRIPVWYCQDCNNQLSAVLDPSECNQCHSKNLKQDEDVLDTWFSSGLWPFSTLGWPSTTEDMKAFYPTDVLETGFDILFFWVARMIMLGIKMTGKIPFHTVYLHPIVRDEYGQKMSKTKGNVVDPLEVVQKSGTDSLRFFFTANTFHGRDIRVSAEQLEAGRNFVNKIWNASRFVLLHFSDVKKESIDWKNEINQWIWTSLNDTKREVNQALDQYRFFDAANRLYHFLWDQYCYWFIEFIKQEKELEVRKTNKDSTAVQVLEEVLRLLHPIMPFVSEELWQKLPLRVAVSSIAIAEYPKPTSDHLYPDTQLRIDRLCRIINEVRTVRGTYNLNPGYSLSHLILVGQPTVDFMPQLCKLGKITEVKVASTEPDKKDYLGVILPELKIFIPRSELGNTENENKKAEKNLADKEAALKRADDKLKNKGFIDNASNEVREGVQKQRDQLYQEILSLREYLGKK